MEKIWASLLNKHYSLLNPYHRELAHEMNQWMDASPLFSESDKTDLARSTPDMIMARMFPTAGYHHLLTCCKSALAFFICDDAFDLLTAEEQEPIQHELTGILNGTNEIIRQNHQSYIFSLVREDILKYNLPVQWLERFVDGWNQYLEGSKLEAPFKLQYKIPAPEEYISIRRKSIAVRQFFALNELVEDAILEPEILQHPLLRQLEELALDVFIYENDLVSFRLERKKRYVMNAVMVIQQHDKVSDEEAFANVVEKRNDRLYSFQDTRRSLTDPVLNHDAVQRYLSGMEKMLTGISLWKFLDTERYDT
ncbi:MAG TPA: hypothetical protein VM802_10915 [Chitinophaga sp.]|uniref:terpene synthase family protein n=1 Tax=Chitinophaga sp. TaxID=1869181 RepID=UPI002C3606DC|nr:hypothetical protein [Chitinophaga sp.]HVI45376.1 hypothetical protein [Chitinophaga sp.]